MLSTTQRKPPVMAANAKKIEILIAALTAAIVVGLALGLGLGFGLKKHEGGDHDDDNDR